jgi:sigma-B regulation protein RsbU (phosphoserine phosphatase)
MAMVFFDSVQYGQRRVQLQSGDVVLFYTDGVTDALDAQGQEFGLDRLQRIALDYRTAHAAELASALDQAVTEFSGASRFDDITVVVARRLGERSS